jgi:TPR repeat protein
MNLQKSELLPSTRLWAIESFQKWHTRFSAWLRAEVSDARFYYIRFRAENGDMLNQYRFGLMYEAGKRVSRSDYEAHKWFLRAAYQGMAEAQAKVSEYSHLGRGVPRNDQEAFNWCRKAAEQGHALSQLRLSQMYADGVGVERNPKEAKKWQSKAATQHIPVPAGFQQQLSGC